MATRTQQPSPNTPSGPWQALEARWKRHWEQQNYFASQPDSGKDSYALVMPPPNITGILHMGHMLNNTVQDILARQQRMQGKEVCWVPGTDHASIATEAKVVAHLASQGVQKQDLTREKFLQHAFAWKEKYGRLILEQLRCLGISCDWSRTRFTMDKSHNQSVLRAFVQLHRQGHIYRGMRMINWDPKGQTALAEEEVIYKEVQGHLYYISYPLVGVGSITIATTRPETMLGDTAICVHPEDGRYSHLIGNQARVPLIDRSIPIIADSYVDPALGTGCLKVTPAHDVNDYAIGERHGLPSINILDEQGRITEQGQCYVGQDRYEARKHILEDLKAAGLLQKTTPHTHQVGYSERTHVPIEPRLSTQWFLRMEELVKPAFASVREGKIKFHPKKLESNYFHWLDNIRDWCISRQLWWGQRIPAYYLADGTTIVAETAEEALQEARKLTGKKDLPPTALRQDEDVLDTWFSSWLWPLSLFDGIQEPGNEEMRYYYPTATLVTGPDIIFFWVARMIIAGHHFAKQVPFHHVYFTGIVRDKQGRKMSKSLGNSPDALALLAKYGADGVRAGLLFATPAGNDLFFDEKLCLQGHHFAHKLGHAFKLIQGWRLSEEEAPPSCKVAMGWLAARYESVLVEVEDHFAHFRLSDALITLYKFVWNAFCAHYLEMIKPKPGKAIAREVAATTRDYLERIVRLLHPFMPFITEELWQELQPRKQGESICIAPWPKHAPCDTTYLEEAEHAFVLITKLRHALAQQQVRKQEPKEVYYKGEKPSWLIHFGPYICKRTGIAEITATEAAPAGALALAVDRWAFWLQLPEKDDAAQTDRLAKELTYTQGFLASVRKKLTNPQFVARAPAHLIAHEQKKEKDALARLATLSELMKEEGENEIL